MDWTMEHEGGEECQSVDGYKTTFYRTADICPVSGADVSITLTVGSTVGFDYGNKQ